MRNKFWISFKWHRHAGWLWLARINVHKSSPGIYMNITTPALCLYHVVSHSFNRDLRQKNKKKGGVTAGTTNDLWKKQVEEKKNQKEKKYQHCSAESWRRRRRCRNGVTRVFLKRSFYNSLSEVKPTKRGVAILAVTRGSVRTFVSTIPICTLERQKGRKEKKKKNKITKQIIFSIMNEQQASQK